MTGAPVPNVCLGIGTADCSGSRPHTDASGRWSTEVPLATPTLVWDVWFFDQPKYAKGYGRFELHQGQTVSYVIYLKPV